MTLLYYILIYRSTRLNNHMEIREILTLMESLEEGRRVYRAEGSLEKWLADVQKHGYTAKKSQDGIYSYYAYDPQGQQVGRFLSAAFGNSRGHLHVPKGVSEGISVVKSDYDLDQMVLTFDIEGPRKGYPLQFTYWDYDEDFENAERRNVFDQLQKQDWYAGMDHPTKMEILDAAYRAIRGMEPSEYQPTVGDEPMDVGDQLDEQQVEEDPVARVERLARELQGR